MGDVGYLTATATRVLGRTADRVQRAGHGSTRARWRAALPPRQKRSGDGRRCWCSAPAMGSATPGYSQARVALERCAAFQHMAGRQSPKAQ